MYDIVDEKEYAKKAKKLYGDDWIEEGKMQWNFPLTIYLEIHHI